MLSYLVILQILADNVIEFLATVRGKATLDPSIVHRILGNVDAHCNQYQAELVRTIIRRRNVILAFNIFHRPPLKNYAHTPFEAAKPELL